MPVDNPYEFNLKELQNGTFICERSFKTNKSIFKDKNNWTATVTIDPTSLDPTSLICSNNNAMSICAKPSKIKFELTEPKICKCCGAMIHDKVCEYCGVEYNYKEV